MTNDATFAQRLVLENEGAGLLAVALGTGLIVSGHRETARRFENVTTVRVVTLNTIHLAFDYGMMLRQFEFSMRREVTLETGCGVLARVHNELAASTTRLDVFATGTVTGFAAAGATSHPF
jgi:hypothetical protein